MFNNKVYDLFQDKTRKSVAHQMGSLAKDKAEKIKYLLKKVFTCNCRGVTDRIWE